jgi:hypothetical protein
MRLRTSRENNGLEKEMRKLFMGAAVAAMVAGSSVAQAAPIANARSDSPVAEADALGGSHLWLGLLAAGLLAFVIWQINDNDSDDGFPTSP